MEKGIWYIFWEEEENGRRKKKHKLEKQKRYDNRPTNKRKEFKG